VLWILVADGVVSSVGGEVLMVGARAWASVHIYRAPGETDGGCWR
jgi:hypothetical protein